jgi:hypothetical protein
MARRVESGSAAKIASKGVRAGLIYPMVYKPSQDNTENGIMSSAYGRERGYCSRQLIFALAAGATAHETKVVSEIVSF